MKSSKHRIIVEMPSTNVAEDGSFAEMVLKNSDKSVQVIRFSPDIMMEFVAKVFELAVHQKIQKESESGFALVHPFSIKSSMAQEDIHHKAVILLFRLLSGLPVSFALPLLEAKELHDQLEKAIEKAAMRLPKPS